MTFVHVDPNSRLGNAILVIGVPLFAVLLYFQMIEFSRAWRSADWPSTQGTIMESTIESHFTQHGKQLEAKIRYAYSVDGQRYENDKVAFGLCRGMLTWGFAGRQIAKYPNGLTTGVYYNPQQPAVSCLQQRGLAWEDIFMSVLSVAGIAVGLKRIWKGLQWARAKWFPPPSSRRTFVRQRRM